MYLLVVAALITMIVKAQDCDTMVVHNMGNYEAYVEQMLPLDDGSVVALLGMSVETGLNEAEECGWMLYKFAPCGDGWQFGDSAYFAEPEVPLHLLKRNPIGNGNIVARLKGDENNEKTVLNIRFFDNNLVFNNSMELDVELFDEPYVYEPFYLKDALTMDADNNIIAVYRNNVARVGFDGTITKTTVDIASAMTKVAKFMPLNTTPVEYCLFGYDDNGDGNRQVKMIVLDENLNIKDVMTHHATQESEIEFSDWGYDFVEADNDSYMFFSNCRLSGQQTVCLNRCSKDDASVLETMFLEEDGSQSICYIVGIAKAADGGYVLAYDKHSSLSETGEVVFVKLDSELNILWKRYISDPRSEGDAVVALDNGGVAMTGFIPAWDSDGMLKSASVFFYALNERGTFDIAEMEMLRPYEVYPNPTSDMIRINCSPDVQPVAVEVYDMQGRLMMRQTTSLQAVNASGLAQGSYMLKVSFDNGTSYSNVIVKK